MWSLSPAPTASFATQCVSLMSSLSKAARRRRPLRQVVAAERRASAPHRLCGSSRRSLWYSSLSALAGLIPDNWRSAGVAARPP